MASASAPPSPSLINAAFQCLFPTTADRALSVAAIPAAHLGIGAGVLGDPFGASITGPTVVPFGAVTRASGAAFRTSMVGTTGVPSGAVAGTSGAAFGASMARVPSGTFRINSNNIVQVYHSSLVPAVTVDGNIIPRQYLNGALAVDENCLAPEFDHDFTDIRDNSKTFCRGNQPYERPCGSYRIALNVKDKFGRDNDWLGMKGDDPNEWPVSYHGTEKHNALDIAQEGFKLSKGKRFRYGKGIYSTPELDVAKCYASSFQHQGTSYKCVMQNRVNPKYLKVVSKEETKVGIYWLSAAEQHLNESELIRPYGLCLFKVPSGCNFL